MAPDRATHRRRVQTGAVPRGTGAHRQPVPGVVPTRPVDAGGRGEHPPRERDQPRDRKSTRLNSSHLVISYAVFCLKKKKDYIDRRKLTQCDLITVASRDAAQI